MRRLRFMAGLTAVLALHMAAACTPHPPADLGSAGSPQRSSPSATQASPYSVEGDVFLLERNGRVRACLTSTDSIPPVCEGLTVHGDIDWDTLNPETHGATRWADASVRGTVRNQALSIVSARPPKGHVEPKPGKLVDGDKAQRAAGVIDEQLEQRPGGTWMGVANATYDHELTNAYVLVQLLVEDSALEADLRASVADIVPEDTIVVVPALRQP